MDARRRGELDASLRSRLDAQLGDAHPLARVTWICEQLENYVERWVGFGALSPSTAPTGRGDELFGVIQVGAALFSDELRRLSTDAAELHEAWQRFARTLSRPGMPDSGTAEELKMAFADVKAALAAFAADPVAGEEGSGASIAPSPPSTRSRTGGSPPSALNP
ncbi:MAG TPA: hypothetical protein VHG08_13780 [Longimicrobium sp.]|nr:hypothetical protein [Longimicrobium sp.]